MFGEEAWVTSGSGDRCPSFPENRPPVVVACLGAVSESLIPLTIAFFFSLKRMWSTFGEGGEKS